MEHSTLFLKYKGRELLQAMIYGSDSQRTSNTSKASKHVTFPKCYMYQIKVKLKEN
jgi:hypothetical protein